MILLNKERLFCKEILLMDEKTVLQYQTEIKTMVDKVIDIVFLNTLSTILIVETRKEGSKTQEE